jgi:superfamily II DNA/RNA helicase
MHGDKSQSQRQKALARFDRGEVTVLVATDVAARGIDVPDVTHVINFDAPEDGDAYTHRVGRTGRAGEAGRGRVDAPEAPAQPQPQPLAVAVPARLGRRQVLVSPAHTRAGEARRVTPARRLQPHRRNT